MSPRVDLFDLMDLPARADMNDDLRDWAAATPAPRADAAKGQRPSADAPCALCAKPARDVCLRCERPACSAHRGVMTGLCDRCVDAAPVVAPRRGPGSGPFADEVPPAHPDVGIDWIE